MYLSLLLSIALSYTSPCQDRLETIASPLGTELNEYLETCQAFGFSGCVLVQRKGELLLRKGYGEARPGLGLSNTPETLFDIGSASKQVTAAAILLLESQGRLELDDSIAKHLPNIPKKHQEVTLYHLLTHTSGFARGAAIGRDANFERALAGVFAGDRAFKSGKRYTYSNVGYAILAGAVEAVSGESFEGWVQTNLFAPAGLRNTGFIETDSTGADLVARAHDTQKLATNYIKGWAYKGMGGVLTSVSDLALWCNALFAGELLPEQQMRTLLTPFKEDYACGWYVFETDKKRKVIQHGGTAGGFGSYIRYFVDDEVLILVTTNRKGWDWQVTWGLSSILLGEDPKAELPPALASIGEAKMKPYCGDWEGAGELLRIRASANGIVVGGIGTKVVSALSPWVPGASREGGAAPSSRSAGDSALMNAKVSAMEIIAELRAGKCAQLEDCLKSGIPKSWPRTVLNRLWPAHLERWGAVKAQKPLGAFLDDGSGRTRVWIELEHERGTSAVELAFVGEQLNILDLNAPAFPVEVRLAPDKSKKMRGFDFGKKAPFGIVVRGKGKKRTLELKTRAGAKLKFKLRAL